MAEQGTHKPFVVGSTPTLATNDIEKIRIKSGFFSMDCMRDDAQVFQFYVGDQGAYLTCESKNSIVRRMATAKLLLILWSSFS